MTENTKPQPPPQNADSRAVWPLVIHDTQYRQGPWPLPIALTEALVSDMHDRHNEGVRKYGVPLVAHNGRDHAADAYQEALDGAVYWRAECERNGSTKAMRLYLDALRHAWACRAYLLERDGK